MLPLPLLGRGRINLRGINSKYNSNCNWCSTGKATGQASNDATNIAGAAGVSGSTGNSKAAVIDAKKTNT